MRRRGSRSSPGVASPELGQSNDDGTNGISTLQLWVTPQPEKGDANALTSSAASSQALSRLGAPPQAITASPIRFGGFHHFGGFHGVRRFHGFGPGVIIGAPAFYYGYGGCAWLHHRALVTGSRY